MTTRAARYSVLSSQGGLQPSEAEAGVPRVVPWVDWAAWSEVSALLFGPRANGRAEGVEKVRSWRSRGRVPVAVDATATLMEVALAEDGGAGAHHLSQFELRLLYGMTITRAINGLVETGQTRFFAEPVSCIASRLGIPSWLVDLRHEATHSQLPSLSNLRLGAQCLLDWLHREYWERQDADLLKARQGALQLLCTYRTVALRVQEEGPHALHRACRVDGGGPRRQPADGLLSETLDGFMWTVTSSLVTAFIIPALVHGDQGETFLCTEGLMDVLEHADGGSPHEIAWSRHRRMYTPLLVRLQRTYTGFCAAVLRAMAQSKGAERQMRVFSAWRSYFCSRDWHSHFDYGRDCAAFSIQQGRRMGATFAVAGIHFNLRDKPPESWTPAEAAFMQSAAPQHVLLRAGVSTLSAERSQELETECTDVPGEIGRMTSRLEHSSSQSRPSLWFVDTCGPEGIPLGTDGTY